MKTSFWAYFSSALGTAAIVLFGLALISQIYINTGIFGLIGIPLGVFCYAWIRRAKDAEVSVFE